LSGRILGKYIYKKKYLKHLIKQEKNAKYEASLSDATKNASGIDVVASNRTRLNGLMLADTIFKKYMFRIDPVSTDQVGIIYVMDVNMGILKKVVKPTEAAAVVNEDRNVTCIMLTFLLPKGYKDGDDLTDKVNLLRWEIHVPDKTSPLAISDFAREQIDRAVEGVKLSQAAKGHTKSMPAADSPVRRD
ncbi:MAG: hypothetical protein ACE5DM_02885, partial [Candidatus Nanoarchaeia archaeon]